MEKMSENFLENLLDWLVSMDFAYYQPTKTPDYDPKCNSHFYLKGSPERFSSAEIVKIFGNEMNHELHERWLEAIIDNIEFNKHH